MSSPQRLDQLTALRFFAALAVVGSHLWPLAEYPGPLQGMARTLLHEGYAGVSFFFMLSGFILAHSYTDRLASGAVPVRRYLVLRVARIAPLHWLVALPLVALELWQNGLAIWPKVLVNLSLLQAWVPSSDWYFTINEPSWSLSDEAFFYACFAVLACWPLRRLKGLAAGLLALNLGVVIWRLSTGHGAVLDGERNTLTHWLTYIDPVARLLDFVVGMLVYHATWRGGTRREMGVVALLLSAMVAYPLLGVPDALRMQLAYLPIMALVIGIFGQGAGGVSRWLGGCPKLVLLGDASFALYLVHLPILHGGLWVQEWLGDAALPWLVWSALVVLVSMGVSVVVYKGVEVPVARVLRRWIEARI